MQLICMWGSQKCIFMYVWVSKLPFFGMWGLEIQFFVCGGPENAIFCGSLKNAFSCKWGSRKFRFFVCGVWKMPFLYVGVWKMPFFISGDLEKYFLCRSLENSISGIWGLENAFLVCGGIKNAMSTVPHVHWG